MNISWEIQDVDIKKINNFVALQINNPFVQRRIKQNIQKIRPEITKEHFWRVLVGCLLSTQQRSGPESKVNQFINFLPFSLTLELCSANKENLVAFVHATLTNFGGIRRTSRIAEEVSTNFQWLEKDGWNSIFHIIRQVEQEQTPQQERIAVRLMQEYFAGFGPKQSRNLLQELGLTKYEIPIDSRITKYLNSFGFPITLSASALSDENYYSFVLDGIQQLCKAANVEPCVLDAAIFSSFD